MPRCGTATGGLSHVRKVGKTAGALLTAPAPGSSATRNRDGRAAGLVLFLFLVTCMNARSQSEKEKKTDEVFHDEFSTSRVQQSAAAKARRFLLGTRTARRPPPSIF
jgi:hypothetical protein